MHSRHLAIGTGLGLSIVGLIAALLFHVAVVRPALTPLPGGGYGETFGPVSAIRTPVYVVCGALVLIGLAFAAISMAARRLRDTTGRP